MTPGENPNRRGGQSYRARLAETKIAKGCADCGYNSHPDALEFDHLPGFEKVAGVNAMVRLGYSWAKIEAEVAKCEVVCANCHRIRTRARLG